MRNNNTKIKNGFTIVETLVVVVLIGVLGTVIITNLAKAKDENKTKKFEKEVEKITSSAALYVESEAELRDSLYSYDGIVTLNVADLVESGLLDSSIYDNEEVKEDTKVTAYLDENEAVQFIYDTLPKNYIKLTPVKETVVIDTDKVSVNLVDTKKVNFCLAVTEGEAELCFAYNANNEYTYKVSVFKDGNEKEVTNPNNYVFGSAGHYAVRYEFTKKGTEETTTRFKYFNVLDNTCVLHITDTDTINVDNEGRIFSKSEDIAYTIEADSNSATQFYVSTNSKLTGQEIKTSAKSGTIKIAPKDNIATKIYLYCFNDDSVNINEGNVDTETNYQEVYVDTTPPTCNVNNKIIILGNKGNNVDGVDFYTSDVTLKAKYGENDNFKDNFNENYVAYRIDQTPGDIEYNIKNDTTSYNAGKTYFKSSKPSTADLQHFYLHVADAANNKCSSEVTFKLDSTAPTLKYNEADKSKKTFVRNDNVDFYSFINQSATKDDTGGSGLLNPAKSSVTMEAVSKNVSYPLPNYNLQDIKTEGAYTLKYRIIDRAGNNATYNFNIDVKPEGPAGEIDVKPLYLWDALRRNKICTGNDNQDCYVYNDQSARNYVSFGGKTFRAYKVDANNVVKTIDPISNGTSILGYTVETYHNRCCNAGCPYYTYCYYKYFNSFNGKELPIIQTRLNNYFSAINSSTGNKAKSYVEFYPYNNSSNGYRNYIFNSYAGLITYSEYVTAAKCSGNSCPNTYLNFGDNAWTMTPSAVYNADSRYYYVQSSGNVNIGNSFFGGHGTNSLSRLNVHPVISFKTTVKVMSGEGTISSPFILGL